MAGTTRPEVLAARTRAQEALRLRMAGATLQQVADQLGYRSRQAVFKATTSLLERQEREVTSEWRALHLMRLERLLLAVWYVAIGGDVKASHQALRILVELGKVTGVSRQMRVVPAPAVERQPGLVMMSETEWVSWCEAALEEVQPLPPEGGAEEDDC